MRDAFTKEAARSGASSLLITAAVSAGVETIDAGYEIAKLGQ